MNSTSVICEDDEAREQKAGSDRDSNPGALVWAARALPTDLYDHQSSIMILALSLAVHLPHNIKRVFSLSPRPTPIPPWITFSTSDEVWEWDQYTFQLHTSDEVWEWDQYTFQLHTSDEVWEWDQCVFIFQTVLKAYLFLAQN